MSELIYEGTFKLDGLEYETCIVEYNRLGDVLKLFKPLGFRVISPRETAAARIQLGRDHSVSTIGSVTSMRVAYLPKQDNAIVLFNDSMFQKIDDIEVSRLLATSHAQESECYIPEKLAECYYAMAKKKDSEAFLITDTAPVPFNSLDSSGLMNFLFHEYCQRYGSLLGENRKKDPENILGEIKVLFRSKEYIESQPSAFIDHIIINRLDYSYINAGLRVLNWWCVRGIREKPSTLERKLVV